MKKKKRTLKKAVDPISLSITLLIIASLVLFNVLPLVKVLIQSFTDFQDFAMSGKTGLSKGENIKNLMKKHAIPKAVYVGDTEGDEQASREAGIPFIWARYGFGTAQTPDAVINSFSELSACAARFFPPA